MKVDSHKLMEIINSNYQFGKTTEGQFVFRENKGKQWKFMEKISSGICRLAYKHFNCHLRSSMLKETMEMLQNALDSEILPVKVTEISCGIRLLGRDGAIYIDAGETVIKIDKTEVKETEAPENIAFLKSDLQLPLPPIVKTGNLKKLQEILGLKMKDWWKILFFLLNAMRPNGPNPILFICGPAASGKTTLTKALKMVLDPSRDFEVLSIPNKLSDLKLAASQCRILALDNLNRASTATEDALCVMATGGGNTHRKLYTTSELVASKYRSVLILTGIGKFTNRADLLDRMVIVETSSIKPRSEEQIFTEFEKHKASIQQGLFNAVQSILANENKKPAVTKSRMQDAVAFAGKAEAHLGFDDGFFARLADEWLNEVRMDIADESILVQIVEKLMETKSSYKKNPAEYRFERRPTEMLHYLLDSANKFALRDKELPRSAAALGKKFQELKTAFKMKGIKITSHNSTKNGGRTIEISFTKKKKRAIEKALKDKPVAPEPKIEEF